MFAQLLNILVSFFKKDTASNKIYIDPQYDDITITPITITNTEIGLYPDNFLSALIMVLQYEGGFSNITQDKGGATNKGITQKEYDLYMAYKGKCMQSVKYISPEEIKAIYFASYWLDGKCNKLPKGLDKVHFDTCVNCGCRQAGKFLQRAVDTFVDGIVGRGTLTAIDEKLKTSTIGIIIDDYIEQRSVFYTNIVKNDPSQQIFLRGWQNRLVSLSEYAGKDIYPA